MSFMHRQDMFVVPLGPVAIAINHGLLLSDASKQCCHDSHYYRVTFSGIMSDDSTARCFSARR